MFDTEVTIPTDADIQQLEQWRREFATAELETPEGYAADGVATAVAVDKGGKLIGSLTASIILATSLDPLLLNPHADRASRFAATFALTKALEYQARVAGAAASFIAVPNLLKDYQEFVTRFGYEETAQHCRLFRHSFRR